MWGWRARIPRLPTIGGIASNEEPEPRGYVLMTAPLLYVVASVLVALAMCVGLGRAKRLYKEAPSMVTEQAYTSLTNIIPLLPTGPLKDRCLAITTTDQATYGLPEFVTDAGNHQLFNVTNVARPALEQMVTALKKRSTQAPRFIDSPWGTMEKHSDYYYFASADPTAETGREDPEYLEPSLKRALVTGVFMMDLLMDGRLEAAYYQCASLSAYVYRLSGNVDQSKQSADMVFQSLVKSPMDWGNLTDMILDRVAFPSEDTWKKWSKKLGAASKGDAFKMTAFGDALKDIMKKAGEEAKTAPTVADAIDLMKQLQVDASMDTE